MMTHILMVKMALIEFLTYKKDTPIWQKNRHKTAKPSQAGMSSRQKNDRGDDFHTDEILC